MMRVALLAPIHNSLYARLVVDGLLKMEEVEVCGLAVRSHWNWRRFKREFARDGVRLLRKIHQKYVLGDKRFAAETENLLSLANQNGLQATSLKDIARQYNIPYLVVSDHNDARCEQFIREKSPQLIAFTGGGLIRKNILAIPTIGVLNCHTGVLPYYRGMDVVEWTAAEGKIGEVGFGATLHLMDAGVDTGPILLKRTIAADKEDDFRSIREQLEVLMVELMLEGIGGLRDGSLKPQPQEKEAGRQYYVMHPRIKDFAEMQLRRR